MSANARRDRDQGSALVIAIVFITVIGLAAALALGYASATVRATANAYQPARERLYTADAAVKATVKYVAANTAAGTDSFGGCNPATFTYGAVGSDTMTTQICPQTNSLVSKGGGSKWGLQTLATGSETGLVVTGQGGVQINGNVRANSAITVDSKSQLEIVAGAISAGGGCTGPISVNGAAVTSCAATPLPADPNYTLAGVTQAPAGPAQSNYCDNATKIATLPGNTTWVGNAISTAIGNCNYVQLLPGIHYLEDATWSIKYRVVGGDLGGRNIKTAAVGEACTQGSNGVTIVLGGSSRIDLSGSTATLEVCGKAFAQASGSVELPLYGPKTDITTTTTGTLATTTNPTGSGWTTPANAKAVDGSVATISLAKNTTASDVVSTGWNLVGGGSIPASVASLNAVVNAVSSSSATFSLAVRNSGDSTNACTGASTAFPNGSNVSGTTTAAVTLNCTKALVAPLTVRLTATSGSGGSNRTIKVDGLTLGYSVVAPTIKAQSGCVVLTGGSGCAVLSSAGNDNFIWLDGEVYLPKAMVDVQLPNEAVALSTLGITVRVLKLQTTSSTQNTPIIAIENGQLNDGNVIVHARVSGTLVMSCRATLTMNGVLVTRTQIMSCTRPT